MLTATQLEEMSQLELEKIDKSGLVDIRAIRIDPSLPPAQRLTNYLEQVKNPYCFLCGDTEVRVRFALTGDALKSKLKNFLISLKTE